MFLIYTRPNDLLTKEAVQKFKFEAADRYYNDSEFNKIVNTAYQLAQERS